ncbi:hypothetical protein H9I32_07275 [Bacillus sp. Xin]|uniref:hypothetical protein n=1 Tax=unclassified Bacillus (in: firmicutes) TaxID=185979 RepID=UPI0015747F47|nr:MULTISPECIES: hypothetical protein [unclassified Bacillus (in: firmicutes)]MBC6972222.1 hypothetical protein [Bacillus sp. Xin]NSW36846.1 hypothetical protein [Bacillus sp. Xin1]
MKVTMLAKKDTTLHSFDDFPELSYNNDEFRSLSLFQLLGVANIGTCYLYKPAHSR